jgi:hypothetical protein
MYTEVPKLPISLTTELVAATHRSLSLFLVVDFVLAVDGAIIVEKAIVHNRQPDRSFWRAIQTDFLILFLNERREIE